MREKYIQKQKNIVYNDGSSNHSLFFFNPLETEDIADSIVVKK
jgi:hypothetical protein